MINWEEGDSTVIRYGFMNYYKSSGANENYLPMILRGIFILIVVYHYQEILLQRAQQNLFINDDCILVYSFKNTKNPLFKKIRFDFALSLFYI